jgi:hypothetical protein
MTYDPPRQLSPGKPENSLEVDLVYNTRTCGTCNFFWPEKTPQTYGPYPSYDFTADAPKENPGGGTVGSFVWIEGVTRPPSFPDAEVMDGCRKAPIMTIGINPNLTAFAPGKTGASWCYPNFSSADGRNSFAKYAYYYRYRSLYQEHFDLKFIEPYLLPDGAIRAPKAGLMQQFVRASDDPFYEIRVQYDGDSGPSAIHLPGKAGQPRYVVVVDANTRFDAGDLLAARLDVPGGLDVSVYAQPISYYTQMLPVLASFEQFLQQQGHQGARLQVGEDVGQLDMVACASPHWGPQWLGGTSQSVNIIVSNCVQKNAWAMKQLVQTAPAILFLVGQASWNMFQRSFGHLIRSNNPLPPIPEDGPYTLLRLTTQEEYRLEFSTKIGDEEYSLSTRLVITPHFSYNENFVPQFRLSPQAFAEFKNQYADAVEFLQTDKRITFQNKPGSFVVAGLDTDSTSVLAELKEKYADAEAALQPAFYDPHDTMAQVLKNMYGQELMYTAPANGSPGFLTRGSGPCQFCVNANWRFPKGCPYGKPDEKKYDIGFLEKVTAAMFSNSTSAAHTVEA